MRTDPPEPKARIPQALTVTHPRRQHSGHLTSAMLPPSTKRGSAREPAAPGYSRHCYCRRRSRWRRCCSRRCRGQYQWRCPAPQATRPKTSASTGAWARVTTRAHAGSAGARPGSCGPAPSAGGAPAGPSAGRRPGTGARWYGVVQQVQVARPGVGVR